MDYKQLVAAALAPALPDLTQEAILDKIEQPKTSKQGDLAFPTFTLAKTLHKAPQMIASDIVEKVDGSDFEKLLQWARTLTSSSRKMRLQPIF